MTLQTFVRLCRGYRDLGAAITEQLDDVLDGRIEDTNRNALRHLRNWLRKVEGVAGDDDELADEIGGTLQQVDAAIRGEEPAS